MDTIRPGLLLRVIPFVAMFSFICWIIFLADTGSGSVFFRFVAKIPYGDKLGHFVLFGVLAFTANLASRFRYIQSWGPWAQWGSIVILLLAFAEELTQAFIPNRGFDLMDGLFDILGVACFTLISLCFVSSSRPSSRRRSGSK